MSLHISIRRLTVYCFTVILLSPAYCCTLGGIVTPFWCYWYKWCKSESVAYGRPLSHPFHAFVLVVGSLLDAIGVVLEGGVTTGVVLLLLTPKHNTTRRHNRTNTRKKTWRDRDWSRYCLKKQGTQQRCRQQYWHLISKNETEAKLPRRIIRLVKPVCHMLYKDAAEYEQAYYNN